MDLCLELMQVSSLDAARVKHMSTQVQYISYFLNQFSLMIWQLPPAGNSEFISALLRDIVSSNAQEGQVLATIPKISFVYV